MAHSSLERADEFLKVFDQKFYRKYSEIESFNASRDPYWRFLLTGMQCAEACKSCPLLRAIVAIEVAVHAGHVGMLPPQAASQMFSGLEAKFGFSIEQSNVQSDLRDERIPEILDMAIKGLPSPDSIPEAVLSRLLKGAENLAVCDHITGWVNESKELAYWKHDFKYFANQILDRLQIDSAKRQNFEKLVVKKIEGAKARRLEGMARSMQDGSLQEMMQKMMRPKVQEYEGGPWRPMTDEEMAEMG
jgi:hypothetical protein